MSTEDLMKPRYKVIADYPSSSYKIGEIIQLDKDQKNAKLYYSSFPAIFSPLEWWEERELTDMPKYLMTKDEMDMFEVVEYGNYIKSDVIVYWHVTKNKGWHSLYDLLPCSESEYLNYTNQSIKEEIKL